ncbi:MAG: PDZ domain-containing protein, partial [Clostridia bacterium]|nr:PDZ domain-containing protein [Clostridia bacterium]
DAEEYADYNDSYYGNYVGIGVTVQWNAEKREITVYNVIPNSPASEVGFSPADVIVAVNGERLAFTEKDTDALDRVGDMIRGEAGTFVDVTVKRGEEEIVLHTERRAVVNPTVYAELLEYGGVKAMYIMITGFDYTTPIAFKEAVDQAESQGAEMILFDLRNNPGGLLSVVSTMLTYLVEDDALLCTTEYQNSDSEVRAGGYVNSQDESPIPSLTVSDSGAISYNQAYADHTLKLPCAVLINSNSASAAELFTSVLRDYKLATLVGENTFGKGCMQVTYSIPGGYALKLTVAYYTPPCGVNYDVTTEGPVGIAPDVEVVFTEEENRQNLYTIDHTVDRQFIAAFNALTTGEKLPMPDGNEQ